MAIENGNETKVGYRHKARVLGLLLVLLRLAALLATVTATIVMALNKQTKSITAAFVGTNPIIQTFTAKFQQTPAFVYFVIANAVASLYNLLVLLLRPFMKRKAHEIFEHLGGMVMVSVVASGAAAAAAMAELGKNGNLHARWNPICNRFDAFCCRGGVALIASFIGASLLMILNTVSTITLYKNVASQD
ncbi:CASP-like protein 1B1 [Elaeis guineensis]|uniref:CASP-like protein n=1 Tax=Elaeis guineensis var. tenera TaxID=51953 RepID=A0A6I9Q7K4_ELAGV|nr:CASP-like protein 1B1 [Elaeis guineensis]